MKVLIVSHSYIAQENRKNLKPVGLGSDIKAVVPNWVYDRVLGRLYARSGPDIFVFKRVPLPRVQFLLGSFDLGLRQFQPDIVHIEYDPWAPIFWQAYFAKRLFANKAALVCTVKKNTFRKLPQPLQLLKNGVANFFIKRVDHFMAVNSGVKAIYTKHFNVAEADITEVQHLGLDTTLFAPINRPMKRANKSYSEADLKTRDPVENSVIIGYCGRLDPHKGVMDLIAALELLRAEGLAVRVQLLGKGSLYDAIQNKADQQQETEYKNETHEKNKAWIELVPPVPHDKVNLFMQGLDIFVMPARITPDHEEHDGHALMEAMACGIACIGTNSGVIPEILSEGSGLLVPEQDVLALADAIKQLCKSVELRQRLGQEAHEKVVSQFSIEAIAAKKFELYEKVLS